MKRKVGVIIRTKNEAKWIRFCLRSLYQQKNIDELSIIIVDCESTDYTVQKVKSVNNKLKVITYTGEYFPGKAINLGARELKDVNYLVILSAHCVPLGKDWLSKLIIPFEQNKKIAASYCCQIPTPATSPENRRDLLNTFSIESRTQTKDSFFHNAASIIKFSIWEKFQFDESLKHIEDRYWAKMILEKGYQIFYNAECSVVHEHGLNQHSLDYKSFRGEGVASLLLDTNLNSNWIDFALKETDVLIIVIAAKMPKKSDLIKLKENNEKFTVLVLPKKNSKIKKYNEFLMKRDQFWADISLYELIKQVLIYKLSKNQFYDYVYFLDGDKISKNTEGPGNYILQSYVSGADMCVKIKSYKEDFFMLEPHEVNWKPLSNSLMDTYENKPHFKKALYGQGVLLRSDDILQSKMPKVVFFDE